MDKVSLEATCPLTWICVKNRAFPLRPLIGRSLDVRATSAFQLIPGYKRASPIEAKEDVPCPVDGRPTKNPAK